MIIIGSLALQEAARQLGVPAPREPADQDCISDEDSLDTIWDRTWHPDYVKWEPWQPFLSFDHRPFHADRYATLDELYTIKLSHSYWVINSELNWDKHIYDMLWLKFHGATLIPELHDILYPIWEEQHGKKQVNLQMTSEEFFGDDAVKRIYDHDSIHDSVAYGDRAMYTYLLKSGEEVAIDHKKMWEWPHEDLVKLFREEVAATALERKVIPSNYRTSPGLAWKWALRRTVTSLTKGKSARFIVEHFSDFMVPDNYVSRHLANRHKLIKLED
jgi:hypothetical protein